MSHPFSGEYHEDKQGDKMKQALLIRNWTLYLLIVGGMLLGATALNMVGCTPAHAEVIECPADSGMSNTMAIHAIVNESGASYAEMRAIAWAIANRKSFGGVYGLRKPLESSEMAIEQATRAWFEVSDDNHGGDHWLSDYDLKHCKATLTAFRFKMTEVKYAGTTHFYKA